MYVLRNSCTLRSLFELYEKTCFRKKTVELNFPIICGLEFLLHFTSFWIVHLIPLEVVPLFSQDTYVRNLCLHPVHLVG